MALAPFRVFAYEVLDLDVSNITLYAEYSPQSDTTEVSGVWSASYSDTGDKYTFRPLSSTTCFREFDFYFPTEGIEPGTYEYDLEFTLYDLFTNKPIDLLYPQIIISSWVGLDEQEDHFLLQNVADVYETDGLGYYHISGRFRVTRYTYNIQFVFPLKIYNYPTDTEGTFEARYSRRLVVDKPSFVFASVDSTSSVVAGGSSSGSEDTASASLRYTQYIQRDVAQVADDVGVIADNTAKLVTGQQDIKTTVQNIGTQIVQSQQQTTQQVIQNQNQNTQEIIDSQKENTDAIIDKQEEATQRTEAAIEKHGNFIIEGLKSLFIPSDEYFTTWFNDMYEFFHDRLGFLMLPVDILIKFIELFQSAGTEFAGIPFPEFKWIDGTVIIPAQTVQFDFLQTDWGKDIQTKLYFVGNVIMIGALLSLMHKKLEGVLRG